MKRLKYLFICLAIGLTSCSEEELNPTSIFQDVEDSSNEFDQWLQKNYTAPFNIQFNYRYVDIESDQKYNLAPADKAKSLALAKLIKHLWIDAYIRVNKNVNDNFMQTYCPKVIQLIGSAAWNDGSKTLGQAEGGLKITLYEVNAIDLNNINMEKMNDLFFHTMHHEFGHILHQTKNYSPDFKLITNADYNSSGWTNVKEEEALHLGFISSYGSSEPDEDFVETLSLYLVHTQAWWDAKLAIAREKEVTKAAFDSFAELKGTKQIRTVTNPDGTTATKYFIVYGGDAKITQKLNMVKDYLVTKWGFSLDDLRTIVQEQSASINTLDLTSYN